MGFERHKPEEIVTKSRQGRGAMRGQIQRLPCDSDTCRCKYAVSTICEFATRQRVLEVSGYYETVFVVGFMPTITSFWVRGMFPNPV